MKINKKNQNGAISLFVLVSMLFFLTFMLGIFTLVNRRNVLQTENLKETQKIYSNKQSAAEQYDSLFNSANNSYVPVTNLEQLNVIKQVADNTNSNGSISYLIDGKVYEYSKDANYVLQNDIVIHKEDYDDNEELLYDIYDFISPNSTYKFEAGKYTIFYERYNGSFGKLENYICKNPEDVAGDNRNIGKDVNYTVHYEDASVASGQSDSGWQILYADDKNVYIITKGYLANESLAAAKEGVYNGTSDFDNLNETKYPAIKDGWLYKVYNNGTKLYNNTNRNMQATEYLLDSTNVKWSGLKNDKAKWVIGGPTLELLVASYNAVHLDNPVSIGNLNEAGYPETLGTGTLPMDNNRPWHHGMSYWFASPSGDAIRYVRSLSNNENRVYHTSYGDENYFRPVVCLKSNVQLEWNKQTNKYDLIYNPELLSADDIAYNSNNIGKAVNYGVNYADTSVASGQPDSGWEILYADNNNVYIITKGTLQGTDFSFFVDSVNVGYNGTSDFTNLNTNKYPAIADGWLNSIYGTGWSSDRESMKATEYMLDSTNTSWSGLKNNQAKWVIGSPTLDLLVASYNKINPTNPIIINDVTQSDALGLKLSREMPMLNTNNANVGYNPWNHGNDYWIASPSTGSYIWYLGSSLEKAWSNRYDNTYAFRPVICLNSDILFKWNNETNKYDIIQN